ncbi:MAG: VanZ family protein [Chloroflexota bacterium]
MNIFTSNRERRLWLWTVAVVIGIYSTLGLAATLAGILRNRGLLDDTFAFGMLLMGIAIVTQVFKTRPRLLEIGVVLGVFAVYLLVFLRMAIPEERSHLIEYSVVGLLIYQALVERKSQGRPVPAPALLAILMTTAIGTLDECIQLAVCLTRLTSSSTSWRA